MDRERASRDAELEGHGLLTTLLIGVHHCSSFIIALSVDRGSTATRATAAASPHARTDRDPAAEADDDSGTIPRLSHPGDSYRVASVSKRAHGSWNDQEDSKSGPNNLRVHGMLPLP